MIELRMLPEAYIATLRTLGDCWLRNQPVRYAESVALIRWSGRRRPPGVVYGAGFPRA